MARPPAPRRTTGVLALQRVADCALTQASRTLRSVTFGRSKLWATVTAALCDGHSTFARRACDTIAHLGTGTDGALPPHLRRGCPVQYSNPSLSVGLAICGY